MVILHHAGTRREAIPCLPAPDHPPSGFEAHAEEATGMSGAGMMTTKQGCHSLSQGAKNTTPAQVVAITERQTDRHPHRACR
jgi:hypothetical protein